MPALVPMSHATVAGVADVRASVFWRGCAGGHRTIHNDRSMQLISQASRTRSWKIGKVEDFVDQFEQVGMGRHLAPIA